MGNGGGCLCAVNIEFVGRYWVVVSRVADWDAVYRGPI